MQPEPDPMIEASVLAGIVRYGSEAFLDASMTLRPESFTVFENQCLWKCLSHLLASNQIATVDRPTLFSAATSLGLSDLFHQSDMKAHVETVYRIPVEQESIERFAKRLRILDVGRDLCQRMESTQEEISRITGEESVDHLLAMAESPAASVMNELAGVVRASKARQFAEGARERFRELVKNPRSGVGIPTGFKHFDRAIGGGVRPGCVALVASRMKIGKSSFANNVSLNVAGQLDIPVLYVDTEMTIEEQQNRAAAAMSGLFLEDVELGRLDKGQQRRLGEAISKLESMPYFHEDVRGLRFDDILSRIRRWVIRNVGLRDDGRANPCLIIFDYFQLLAADDMGRMAEHQALAFNAKKLKDQMATLGTACLAFAQQNRDGIDFKDERVLRGADRILDTVTSFWLFCRKAEADIPPNKPGEPKYTHELYYQFSRFGPGLPRENYINIATDYSRGYMGEGPTRDELFQQSGGLLKGVASGRVHEQPTDVKVAE